MSPIEQARRSTMSKRLHRMRRSPLVRTPLFAVKWTLIIFLISAVTTAGIILGNLIGSWVF